MIFNLNTMTILSRFSCCRVLFVGVTLMFFFVFQLRAQDLSVRSIDGSNNNLLNPNYGKTHIPFRRFSPASYQGDGSTIVDRVSPRIVSNAVAGQSIDNFSDRNVSTVMFSFLQFIDHDITLTELSEGEEGEQLPISVPKGDVFFDPNNTGVQTIPMTRASALEGTGEEGMPREQINLLTAWIDASNVYGSDEERANWLRSFKDGKLKISYNSKGEMTLPCNTVDGDCGRDPSPAAPFMDNNRDRCGNLLRTFVAGDIRANEAPGLLAFHTLFVLEHNRICDDLISRGYSEDEYIYQTARRLVIGKIQAILYNEVLPVLGINLSGYSGYNPSLSPDIFNEFATAAYRLGHTMVHNEIPFIDSACDDAIVLSGCGIGTEGVFGGVQCSDACTSREIGSPLGLRNAFFNPSLVANNGLAEIFRGMVSKTQRSVDPMVVDDLRNFLFGPPGAGGLDLVAINLQRGRDHGLPDYNTLRVSSGLPRVNSFFDITDDLLLALRLSIVYRGNVDNIDPWIAMVSEPHLPSSEVGVTINTVLRRQFELLRDADRFWYENDPEITNEDLMLIRNTKLADIINVNTELNLENVFFQSDCDVNIERSYCSSQGGSTDSEWIQSVLVNGIDVETGNDLGYADNTSIVFTVFTGSNGMVLIPGYGEDNLENAQRWAIWIDLDQNNTFEDNELVFDTYGRSTVYKTLNIPATALSGQTRMRVMMSGDAMITSPCMNIQSGEVEDFTVDILGGVTREVVEDIENGFVVSEDQVEVFPNPVFSGERIDVHYPFIEGGVYDLKIANSFGDIIYKMNVELRKGENMIQLPTEGLSAGLYHLLLYNGVRSVAVHFIVLKR